MADRKTGAEARERIIGATAVLVQEHGVGAMTVTRVMACAGVSRTTFYRHFTDPYAVLGVLLQRIGEELIGRSGDWLNEPQSIGHPRVMYANLLGYAQAYELHGRLLSAIADAAGVDDRVNVLWWGLLQAFIDGTAAAIERDQAAGAVRAAIDARATSYALTLMGERVSYDLMGRRRGGTPEDYGRRETNGGTPC